MDQPRLHSSYLLVYILLILPPSSPPSPFLLPRHGRFHRCKIEAGLDRRPRMERGRLVEIVDRRFQAFTGSPGWLAPGYLETRPRKERFRVTTPAPTSSRSNSAVLPRLSTQIGRVFCPSTGSTIPMIAPPISVIGPKFFPLGGGGRKEGRGGGRDAAQRAEGYFLPALLLESFFLYFFAT